MWTEIMAVHLRKQKLHTKAKIFFTPSHRLADVQMIPGKVDSAHIMVAWDDKRHRHESPSFLLLALMLVFSLLFLAFFYPCPSFYTFLQRCHHPGRGVQVCLATGPLQGRQPPVSSHRDHSCSPLLPTPCHRHPAQVHTVPNALTGTGGGARAQGARAEAGASPTLGQLELGLHHGHCLPCPLHSHTTASYS